jgi:hypothetical protein
VNSQGTRITRSLHILSEKPTDGADQSVRRDEASTSVMQIAIRAQAAWILQAAENGVKRLWGGGKEGLPERLIK